MPDPTSSSLWQPRYTLTPPAVRALLEIEAARAVVDHTPFPPAVAEELRRRARLRSTHYSTRIEGNRDVPALMAGLVHWVEWERKVLPVPVIAGLAHYQFVTIHPYFDGNGRTARLLATFLLHRGGYGLNGFFSLEEYHARDLAAYYGSLVTHPHHNYYEGRAEADLSPWLEYFLQILSAVLETTLKEALPAAEESYRQLNGNSSAVDRQ